MKLNEPVIKLCSKSRLHTQLPPSLRRSLWYFRFAFFTSFFFCIFFFLICFLWFTANFTLGVWREWEVRVQVSLPAPAPVPRVELARRRRHKEARQPGLIDFLISSRGWQGGGIIVIGFFKGRRPHPVQVDRRILCKLDPQRN